MLSCVRMLQVGTAWVLSKVVKSKGEEPLPLFPLEENKNGEYRRKVN